MAKKGRIVVFLSFLVALSASITIQFPASSTLRVPVQTEIVAGYEETLANPESLRLRETVSKAYNILRWHNHTINLHLRNVRSKWLTIHTPEGHLPVNYPEEHDHI